MNPFIITGDAEGLIAFLTEVFDGAELPDARTIDDDGLLLHAELSIGDTTVMFAERKADWPYMPSLLQVYVGDVAATLATAERLGATIITKPTPFFGDVLSRFLDPWKNLWWVYRHGSEQSWGNDGDAEWGGDEPPADGATDAAGWSQIATPELVYIHDTLLATIPRLRE